MCSLPPVRAANSTEPQCGDKPPTQATAFWLLEQWQDSQSHPQCYVCLSLAASLETWAALTKQTLSQIEPLCQLEILRWVHCAPGYLLYICKSIILNFLQTWWIHLNSLQVTHISWVEIKEGRHRVMNNWDRVRTNHGGWTGNGRGTSTPPDYCQGSLEEGTELPNANIAKRHHKGNKSWKRKIGGFLVVAKSIGFIGWWCNISILIDQWWHGPIPPLMFVIL